MANGVLPDAASLRAVERAAVSRRAKAPRLRWPIIWTVVVAGILAWGSRAHLERYITPQRGFGYALGIMGGSMMILLLLYSARKRLLWLR